MAKKEAAVPMQVAEPELRVVISAGTQGGGSAHQVIVSEMKNFEDLWSKATPHIVKLAKLSPVPTTDLDAKEIKNALEGEPVTLGFEFSYQGDNDRLSLGCKPNEVEGKMASVGLIIASYVEYRKERAKAMKELTE